jgi:uncharacterized protein YlxP (DUF503 family)
LFCSSEYPSQSPHVSSIKDKRRIVQSIKERWYRRFRVSAAEVDLQDSLSFAQIGCAIVSNAKDFGEAVLNKALAMVEEEPVRIYDVSIYSQEF